MRRTAGLLVVVVMTMATTYPLFSSAARCPEDALYEDFAGAQRVSITGYDDDAMEPFVSRDGAVLFFNNLNQPDVNTNLHFARRLDAMTFEYGGEIEGANTPALEGVPTMDRAGRFYFVSTRSYQTTFSTLYQGRFANGRLTDVALVAGVSRREAGVVNFDVEISPDGETLYFVDAQFSPRGEPLAADLVIAQRQDDGFTRANDSAGLLANVNTAAWEYAAAVSADGLELFFTRADIGRTPGNRLAEPKIFRAARPSLDEPFGCPARVGALDGFVEAPALSPDARALYYHRLENGRFRIYRVTR